MNNFVIGNNIRTLVLPFIAPEQPVTFTDTSTNTPTSYDWDFGDGTITNGVTTPSVEHRYTTVGTYTVIHKAYNNCGPSTNTCSQDLSVLVPPKGGDGIILIGLLGLGLLGMVYSKK